MVRTLAARSGRIGVALLFEPRDLWIGVYWRRDVEPPSITLTVYVCLVPMLPLRVSMPIGDLLEHG